MQFTADLPQLICAYRSADAVAHTLRPFVTAVNEQRPELLFDLINRHPVVGHERHAKLWHAMAEEAVKNEVHESAPAVF
ncbi:MAG: hypothetical protein H7224_00305 [Polaromonas sp.]|nr:hypothetical protein [Polaromonas sp.]